MFLVVMVMVVVCLGGSICTGGEQELPPTQHLSQSDAEAILSAQTILRRYFIEALANLHDYITGLNPFYSVVGGILQGLRSRDLDPLKSFGNGYDSDSNQSAAYQMADIVCGMQGCSSSTLTEWRSFLQIIPQMTHILPPPPIIPRLDKPNPDTFPYTALLLLRQNRLQLNNRLLKDILYNYPFRNHSPDLAMAIEGFIRKLQSDELYWIFNPTESFIASGERPDDILSDIIQSVWQRQREQDRLEFETAVILRELSHRENIHRLRGESAPWELLQLIGEDDYPKDVVGAARRLADAIRDNEVNVAVGSLKGYSPLQQLLGLISNLISEGWVVEWIDEDPFSRLAQGIYPHVKLRYLSSTGQFFRPQSSSDVAFLLNSFLTSPVFLPIKEVHDIFLLSEFNWRRILVNFDYSKYSNPRSLLLDMLKELQKHYNGFPNCDKNGFSNFLHEIRTGQSNFHYYYDGGQNDFQFNDQKPSLPLLPDLQEKIHPTAALTFPICSNGPAVAAIDPDSIIEIFSTNVTLVSDLIRLNPMPAARYPSRTRLAVLQAVMKDLRTGRNDNSVVEAVVRYALMRMPLNEKADFPPRYLHVCPLVGRQQPAPLGPASSGTATLQPSTFLSSVPPSAATTATASVTIAAVDSSSSTSDTTPTVSPTTRTAFFSRFFLPVNTAQQQFSSSFSDNPASPPAELPAVGEQSSSFSNSTL